MLLVNPTRETLYGQAALPESDGCAGRASCRHHGNWASFSPADVHFSAQNEPVDAVLALVNAERAIDVVEEAAALGCGGVVIAAAGFVEAGRRGCAALQERLQDARAARVWQSSGPTAAGSRTCRSA